MSVEEVRALLARVDENNRRHESAERDRHAAYRRAAMLAATRQLDSKGKDNGKP